MLAYVVDGEVRKGAQLVIFDGHDERGDGWAEESLVHEFEYLLFGGHCVGRECPVFGRVGLRPVSYTHLTLPTICSV